MVGAQVNCCSFCGGEAPARRNWVFHPLGQLLRWSRLLNFWSLERPSWLALAKVGSFQADRAHGGGLQPNTVTPHSRPRKHFKGWRAGKVEAAAVEQLRVCGSILAPLDSNLKRKKGIFLVVTALRYPVNFVNKRQIRYEKDCLYSDFRMATAVSTIFLQARSLNAWIVYIADSGHAGVLDVEDCNIVGAQDEDDTWWEPLRRDGVRSPVSNTH